MRGSSSARSRWRSPRAGTAAATRCTSWIRTGLLWNSSSPRRSSERPWRRSRSAAEPGGDDGHGAEARGQDRHWDRGGARHWGRDRPAPGAGRSRSRRRRVQPGDGRRGGGGDSIPRGAGAALPCRRRQRRSRPPDGPRRRPHVRLHRYSGKQRRGNADQAAAGPDGGRLGADRRREPARVVLLSPGGGGADDRPGTGGSKAAGWAERSYGKIVNLSSISGRRGRPLAAHYAASKAAVISITQSAALALAPYNINVNAVCPGVVPTAMWQQIDLDRVRLFGLRPGEAMASFVDSIPLRRAGTPEDIAAAVAFFCSPDADYITGQTLNVDGGYEMD